MATTDKVQRELLALDWKDFSTYPQNGQPMMVHAEGFDTQKREWKHLFFELESFSLMDFPTEKMLESLNRHHCKWKFQWLPPKKQK